MTIGAKISMALVYLLFAYSILIMIAFVATVADVPMFIRQTGGQHCWIYSNMLTYTLFNVAEIAGVAAIAYASLRLVLAGYRWQPILLCCLTACVVVGVAYTYTAECY